MTGVAGPAPAADEEGQQDIRSDRIVGISVQRLHPNPFNPRVVYRDEDIDSLAASIRAERGVLQELSVAEVRPFLDYWRKRLTKRQPGLVHDLEEALGAVPSSDYVILIGHNRRLALERAGRIDAPCRITNVKIPRARLLSLPENMQRVALNPIEQALAYQGAIDDGLTQYQVAEQTGTTQPLVSRRLKLLRLPEEVRQAVMDGLAVTEAEILLDRLDTQEQVLRAWKVMRSDGLKAVFAAARVLTRPAEEVRTPSCAETEEWAGAGEENRQEASGEACTAMPQQRDAAAEQAAEEGVDPAAYAAQRRDEACRALIAMGVPSNPREIIRLLAPALLVEPTPAARERARIWFSRPTVAGKKGASGNGPSKEPFDDIVSKGNVKAITLAAFALALATLEVRMSDTSRTWDAGARAYLAYLKASAHYQPTEWELSRLRDR